MVLGSKISNPKETFAPSRSFKSKELLVRSIKIAITMNRPTSSFGADGELGGGLEWSARRTTDRAVWVQALARWYVLGH